MFQRGTIDMNIWHDIDEKRIQKEDFMCYI